MECKLYMYINNWCILCYENASSSVASAICVCRYRVSNHGSDIRQPVALNARASFTFVISVDISYSYSLEKLCCHILIERPNNIFYFIF